MSHMNCFNVILSVPNLFHHVYIFCRLYLVFFTILVFFIMSLCLHTRLLWFLIKPFCSSKVFCSSVIYLKVCKVLYNTLLCMLCKSRLLLLPVFLLTYFCWTTLTVGLKYIFPGSKL